MATVKFITSEGATTELDVDAGINLMHAAVSNGIYEIVGDCGGSASCATCHVYLAPEFEDKVAPPGEREQQMLASVAADRMPNSRLSCQIVMEDRLEGIRLHIPATQW
jgi:2Fe-2S ferredoxin